MSLIEHKSQQLLDEQIHKAIAVVSSQVSVKVSATTLASNVTFDPNAIDGDGDGIVQDGSPFERPAVITAISVASQRVANILAKASRVTNGGRHTQYQRRYSGMSATDIAQQAVPDSFEGWASMVYEHMRIYHPEMPPLSSDASPTEIKNMVRSLEDWIEPSLKYLLSPERNRKFEELKRTDREGAIRFLFEGIINFDPKEVAKNRQLVEHVLTTNPQFRELVDKYGLPPIIRFGENIDAPTASGMMSLRIGMFLESPRNIKSQGRADFAVRRLQKWFGEAVLSPKVGSKRTKRFGTRSTPEALLIHEYGHYLINSVGAKADYRDFADDLTPHWQAWSFGSTADWEHVFSILGHPEWYDEYKRIDNKGVDVPDYIPHVETAYGESSPIEAFAESVTALFAHDGVDSDLVSEGMKKIVADLLELDNERDIREQLTPSRTERRIVPDGLASRGSITVLNEHRDPFYGDMSDNDTLSENLVANGTDIEDMKNLRPIDARTGQPITPEERTEARVKQVKQLLDDNPTLANMIRRHGSAKLYFSDDEVGFETLDGRRYTVRGITQFKGGNIAIFINNNDQEDWGIDALGEQLPESMIARLRELAPDTVTRHNVGDSVETTVRHEIAHSIHLKLVNKVRNGEIKGERAKLILAYRSATWEGFFKTLGRPDLLEEFNARRRNDELPYVDSVYAFSTPLEMLAESFAAYSADDPAFHALLGDTSLRHMNMIFGDRDSSVSKVLPEAFEKTFDAPEGFPYTSGTYDPATGRFQIGNNTWTNVREDQLDDFIAVAIDDWNIEQQAMKDGVSPDGLRSIGPSKPYPEHRAERIKRGKGKFTRSEQFRNTTTEQKVALAIPDNETDYGLMVWDQILERMGLTYKQASKIDLTDPYNPKIPRSWRAIQDTLDEYVSVIKRDLPDFDPDIIKQNRDALQATLDAFPHMREMAERFGIPPLGTMTDATVERALMKGILDDSARRLMTGQGTNLRPEIMDVLPDYISWRGLDEDWDTFIGRPEVAGFRAYLDELSRSGELEKAKSQIYGGFAPGVEAFLMPRHMAEGFRDGRRVKLDYTPAEGDWAITDNSYEGILLHEYGHYLDQKLHERARMGDKDALRLVEQNKTMYENVDQHLKTEYGKTIQGEFAAESFAAVLMGNPDAEAMLSPEARRWAREASGLPETDPLLVGDSPAKPKRSRILDRFGRLWQRGENEDTWLAVSPDTNRSAEGVPDVLETMSAAKQRTGNVRYNPVTFDHEGRTFRIRQDGDTFQIDINGRTVASADVVEGQDGLPEITNVDVTPGYEGVAPDQDLYDMVVDHARKQYPSARAPRKARKTDVVSDGFASRGPEHADLTGLEGTPGTPEYISSLGSELENAKSDGKRVQFLYNGELRDVEVEEIIEKNGVMYLKGKDSLRGGEGRTFRLDRVSMPKIVKNPDTGKSEAIRPPSRPHKPVPVFTGKAADIFEGAKDWEEVAQRLSKGRYVFFDFETTGIEEDEFRNVVHPGTPTQIGLVEIVDGKVTRRWSTHVNPGRPMYVDPKTGRSWSAENLKYTDPDTGEIKLVTDEWLAQQKPLKDALQEMLDFIGPMDNTILGGQNHPYDDSVMQQALLDAGLDSALWKPEGFIDSMALARELLDKNSDEYPRNPKTNSKTVALEHLSRWLGYDPGDGWHSADTDAEASWEAFSRLVRRAADDEASGKPVKRDLLDGKATDRFRDQMESYDRQLSAYISKVRAQREAVKADPEANKPDNVRLGSLPSVGSLAARRAANPARWDQLTPEQRNEATQASARAAIDYLNALSDAGIDVNALRDMDRAELDSILQDLIPGGEARVSDYVTGDGKNLIEVSNATMGQVFMALGFHVEVISDDPNEHHLLENGINDMQNELQNYVKAVAKDPDALLKDAIFTDWAERNGIDIAGLEGKKLEKAAKKFAEQFEINLCLYYKAGSNMLCGENIGIEREDMPQLGGRMKGDDTLAAKAIKSGLMTAKELQIDPEKLAELEKSDPAMAARVKELMNVKKSKIDSAEKLQLLADLAKKKDPVAKAVFDSMNWNDSEANVEPILDQAAAALGIVVEKPRFVDPATMLGAQNQLQGSKVENMADGAVEAVGDAVKVLQERFGRAPTNDELMDYLANEIKHGLFQPTLTAGNPGSQTYMLDGHHRWSGLLMANKKLEAMGSPYRVQLNIRNYQTDIRTGLELGRAMQVAMGVKDAKLAGEDPFVFDGSIPDITPDEFDSIIGDILDPANVKKQLQEVRAGKKFRATESFDEPGQATRLAKRQRPIEDVVQGLASRGATFEPQSRVEGVKAQRVGYRAAGTGSGWQSLEDHVALETERGNPLFEGYQDLMDKGYDVAWVTHDPKEAGRYVVNAGDVDAWRAGQVNVDPANIDELDLSGSILVGKDDEGGFLYARQKAMKPRVALINQEERLLDSYDPTGEGFSPRYPGRLPEKDKFPKLDTSEILAGAAYDEAMAKFNGIGYITEKDEDSVRNTIQRLEDLGQTAQADKLRKALDRAIKYREQLRARMDEIDTGPGFQPYVGAEPRPFLKPRAGNAPLVWDDWATEYFRQKKLPEKEWRNVDSLGAPLPGEPIYRETVKLEGTKYTFEVDADGIVTAYKGNRDIATLRLDRGFSHINGKREANANRHFIEYVSVDKKHRRRGVATEMAKIAEHVYGGQVEHSRMLSPEGRKWRDADMGARGTPGAKPLDDPFDSLELVNGFASRGPSLEVESPGIEKQPTINAPQSVADIPLTNFEQSVTDVVNSMSPEELKRIGIDKDQWRGNFDKVAEAVDKHVGKYLTDSTTRDKVAYGLKLLAQVGTIWARHRLGPLPVLAGHIAGDDVGPLDSIHQMMSAGLHDMLRIHGEHYAQLVATEMVAMGIATRQKAKEMIADIKQRMNGTGEYIGTMSREAWNRLRGAWARVRPTAPIPGPTGVKHWIIAGHTPRWAELSWNSYSSKSRVTQKLRPTNARQWTSLATKVGPSPELVDIAAYRAGIGYGYRRVKPRDVVRVYL